jgi:hypothetical protein
MTAMLDGQAGLRACALPLLAATIAVGGCGGGSGADSASSDAPALSTTESESAADAGPPPGSSTLQRGVWEAAEFTDELVTADGTGRIFVLVDCDPMTGGNHVTINPVGFPAGRLITAEADPAIGGSVQAQIGPDGSGVGMRQTSLDEEQYRLSIALDDEGLETTFPGCAPTGS